MTSWLTVSLPYLLPILIIGFFAWRWIKFRATRKMLPELMKQGAQVIDVRSPTEFKAGHCPGSQNIPLGDLVTSAKKLNREKPVILCCASGARSGAAVGVLKKQGFNQVFNAGPWQNLLGISAQTR